MGKTLYELEQSYKKMGQEYEELGRQIEELKKEKRIAKIGELVTVGGIEWKILDKVDGGYFAIANDKICDMKFDDVSNDWCNSDIRKYLDREIVPKVQCDMNGYSLVDFERDLTSLDGQKEYGKCRDKIKVLFGGIIMGTNLRMGEKIKMSLPSGDAIKCFEVNTIEETFGKKYLSSQNMPKHPGFINPWFFEFAKFIEKNKNDIVDVKVIVPGKVVEVQFYDGTKEKSVCQEPDVFSMEQAIAICISKKIMGGSGAYNNAIRKGMKIYENKLKHEAEVKAEQERIERKHAKRKAQREKCAAKRAEQEAKAVESEREEMINIIVEAIKRANG